MFNFNGFKAKNACLRALWPLDRYNPINKEEKDV